MGDLVALIVGSFLALTTWLVLLAVLSMAGLAMSVLLQPSRGDTHPALVVRHALWWGFALFTILILVASLTGPLGGAVSAVLVMAPLVILGLIGGLLFRRAFSFRGALRLVRPSHRLMLVGIFITIVGYFSVAALGPANNYDTGLYHLGAIGYASDYGTLSGVANLYFPFGYANSHFAVAGWLSSTPWGLEGYRLLNGLVIVLALADLLMRWTRRPVTSGTWVLTIGLAAAAFPLISIADFWITSPTSDSAVLLLSIVAGAYLVDAVVRRRPTDCGVSIILVTLMVAMRPTMIVFAAAVLLVVSLVTARSWDHPVVQRLVPRVGAAAGLIAASIGGLQLARDRMLSGWLVYPLSYAPVEVPWRAPDPTPVREATLAAARDPSALDQYAVAHSWDWIATWFLARWQMWETYMFLGLLLLGAVMWWTLRTENTQRRRHVLGALWLPSGLALLTWFFLSPPSYRFAWGPLVVFAIGPLVAVLSTQQFASGIHSSVGRWVVRVCVAAALGLVLIAVTTRTDYASMTLERTWSLGIISIPYFVSPPPLVATSRVATEGGVEVLIPIESDQCWNVYPLCSPLPPASLRFAGEALPSGFES